MGLKPSKGGSLTFQMRAGGGLGELRPKATGASLMAEGAIIVESWVEVRVMEEWLCHVARAMCGKGGSLALGELDLCCMCVGG